MADLFTAGFAIFSECGLFRFRLDRSVSSTGAVFAYFGVNGSNRGKLPARLRPRLDELADMIFASKKPVKIFGLTRSGDPLHPLTLPYSTPLTDWMH